MKLQVGIRPQSGHFVLKTLIIPTREQSLQKRPTISVGQLKWACLPHLHLTILDQAQTIFSCTFKQIYLICIEFLRVLKFEKQRTGYGFHFLRPNIIIRFNPDVVRWKGKAFKPDRAERIDLLVNVIKDELSREIHAFEVKLLKLWYDDKLDEYKPCKVTDITENVAV